MDNWLFTPYSQRLFERIGMTVTPDVAGIAEDGDDIVVWYHNGTESRFEGQANGTTSQGTIH